MQFLCFLGFYMLWSVQWLGHLLPPVPDLLQGFMCVCAQVSCNVVSNWPLCDLFVDVCIVIFCISFLIPQFCLFLRHQTMDKVQKHNSFEISLPSPTILSLDPALNQLYPAHTLTPCFFKTHFHVILTFMLRSPKWSISFRFPEQRSVCVSYLSYS
jgi:hypothetical protein